MTLLLLDAIWEFTKTKGRIPKADLMKGLILKRPNYRKVEYKKTEVHKFFFNVDEISFAVFHSFSAKCELMTLTDFLL